MSEWRAPTECDHKWRDCLTGDDYDGYWPAAKCIACGKVVRHEGDYPLADIDTDPTE